MSFVLFFFYGSALGSFVNVIVTRLGVAPIAKARSKCLSCGKVLSWKELLPVLSYIILGGKCKTCKTKYGQSNLVVEIMYGLIFVCIYMFMLKGQATLFDVMFWLVYYTLFFVTLGVVSLYDLKHKVIPLKFFYGFLSLSLLVLGFRFLDDHSFLTLLSPIVVASPFLFLWIISRGKWLGFGDVLMYMAVGAFFGVAQGLAVFFISVWLGALYGISLKILESKKYTMKSALPFVPFISIALIIVLFTDIDIVSIMSLLK